MINYKELTTNIKLYFIGHDVLFIKMYYISVLCIQTIVQKIVYVIIEKATV